MDIGKTPLKFPEMQLFLVAFFYSGGIIITGDGTVGKKEKLIARLLSKPSDFTFEELATLLNQLGYLPSPVGKTGGSRVAFSNDEGAYIRLHKPHPRNILKAYQIDDIIAVLRERGLL